MRNTFFSTNKLGKLRKHVDTQILVKHLPLFFNTINVQDSLGDIYLGKDLSTKTKVFIRSTDVMRHVGIFGSTGSGKTTTAAVIAKQLSKKMKVFVIDWHGEYKDLLNDVNVLKIGTSTTPTINLRIEEALIPDIVEIFEDVFDLTPTQSYIVMKVLKEHTGLNITHICDIIESLESSSKWFYESKLSLLRKLSSLDEKIFRDIFEKSGTELSVFIKSYNTVVIDLSLIKNITLRKLVALVLIKYIEKTREHSLNTPLALIVDEAHNIFTKNSNISLVARLFGEIRKRNVGIIALTQSPTLISPHILRNTNTKIVHSIKSWSDKEILGDSLGLCTHLKDKLSYLDVGEALVSAPNLKEAHIVKIDNSVLH